MLVICDLERVLVPLLTTSGVDGGFGVMSMTLLYPRCCQNKSRLGQGFIVNRLPIKTLIDYFTDYPRYNGDAKNRITERYS